MPIKIIGKSILGDLGFSQNVSVMGERLYFDQLDKIKTIIPFGRLILMTSMTGIYEVKETGGEYFPKIREYRTDIGPMFSPNSIYNNCLGNKDKYRPGCDFIIFDAKSNFVATTFSREAPILAFESSFGRKALGVILRPSLMKYGDYLFSTIKEDLINHNEPTEITVTLVTCNHFEYQEGSIPSIIQSLADKYDMKCIIGDDSENNPECYHRGEKGNHVVALW